MPISIDQSQIEGVADFNEGDEVTLKITARQITGTKDGEAEFEIVSGSARPATQEETGEVESFDDAKEQARQEVLNPSTTGTEDEQNRGV